MPIDHHDYGTSITGPAAMELYRLATIRSGLLLEIRTDGAIKLSRHHPKMTTYIRREFGWKGNREALLAQLDAYIAVVRQGVAITDHRTNTTEE